MQKRTPLQQVIHKVRTHSPLQHESKRIKRFCTGTTGKVPIERKNASLQIVAYKGKSHGPTVTEMSMQCEDSAYKNENDAEFHGLHLVRAASREILTCIRHQMESKPVSMGEYVRSPQDQLHCPKMSSPLIDDIIPNSDTKEMMEYNWLLQDGDSALEVHRHDAKYSGTSTVTGSIFTLTNTILGSGTLTVPFAIASSGWLLGNLVMISIALITRYSVHLLLLSSDLAGKHAAKTYESLGHHIMGKFGTFLAEFTFIFGGFGTLVSYIIFITDLFSNVLGVELSQKWIVTLVYFVIAVLPLSLYRKIGKLRISSLAAIVSIAYVVFFVLIAFLVGKLDRNFESGERNIQAIRIESGSVYTVTLLIAAFACHNTALPVYEELRSRSLKRMDRAVFGAICIAFLLYEAIGLFGYLQFGTHTRDNVLLNFTEEYVHSMHPSLIIPLRVGQTCMAVALLLTVPVAMWPFRSCLLSVYLRWRRNGRQTPSHCASRTEYIVVTVSSQSLIVFCSIFVPSVKVALSIVGSVSGSLLIFIMPSLFYLMQVCTCVRDARHHLGAVGMFILGIAVGALGLSLTLYKVAEEYGI